LSIRSFPLNPSSNMPGANPDCFLIASSRQVGLTIYNSNSLVSSLFGLFSLVISKLLKILVRIYQMALSPMITLVFGTRCRFYPTCSNYALQSLESKPLTTAIKNISGRLCKCGPWHPGGVDFP
jgi:uncharacterized protein